MNEPIDLAQKLALFEERFSPRIVATMNDYKIEVVKVEGEFVWHSHPETDDFFLVLEASSRSSSAIAPCSCGRASCSSCHAASSIVPAPAQRRTSS